MSDGTHIEWTDASWTPIRARTENPFNADPDPETMVGWHCEQVSPGCNNCYAQAINHRLGTGLPYHRNQREKVQVFLDVKTLVKPLHWKKPRKIFVCSMTDLFGEWVPDGYIVAVWMMMARADWHTYQVLTKRPDRMRDFVARWNDHSGEDFDFKGVRGPEATRAAHPSGRGQLFAAYLDWLGSRTGGQPPDGAAWPTFDWAEGPLRWSYLPLPNVWLGTSVENQHWADLRIPHLLATQAAVRFLSCEPLLGPLDLFGDAADPGPAMLVTDVQLWPNTVNGLAEYDRELTVGIDWVIGGGESGAKARPCYVAWLRSLRDQCAAAGVPFFLKQLGSHVVSEPLVWGVGQSADNKGDHWRHKLRDRHGSNMAEWPEDLRVREFPGGAR